MKLDYDVVIYETSGGEIANVLRGYIIKGNERIRFTGIAYGRFGGQNVVPRFSKKARQKIIELFGDIEEFETDLQERLVSGNFRMVSEK